MPEGGCDCAVGFEGNNCDVRVTSKFLGTYKITSTNPNKATVKDSTSNLTRLYFTNVGNGDNIKLNFYGDIDGYHVIIPKQTTASSNTFYALVDGEACFEKNDNTFKITFKLRFNNSTSINRFVYFQ